MTARADSTQRLNPELSVLTVSSVFSSKSGGECHAERLHSIGGGLRDPARSLLHLSPAGQVISEEKSPLNAATAGFVLLQLRALTLCASCLQVSPGWSEHAGVAGRRRHQRRRGALVPSVSQRRPRRPPAVSVWNPGEVHLQADVSVGALLHPSGGDHPRCSRGHSGTLERAVEGHESITSRAAIISTSGVFIAILKETH